MDRYYEIVSDKRMSYSERSRHTPPKRKIYAIHRPSLFRLTSKTKNNKFFQTNILSNNPFVQSSGFVYGKKDIKSETKISLNSFVSSNIKILTNNKVDSNFGVKQKYKLKLVGSVDISLKSKTKINLYSDVSFGKVETYILRPLIPQLTYSEPDDVLFSQGQLNDVVVKNGFLELGLEPMRTRLEDSEDVVFDEFYKVSGDWIREYWNNQRGYVYRSNYISDSQRSEMNFEINVPLNAIDAKISLDYYISSQKDKDNLVVMVDSEPIKISGDIGWSKQPLIKNVERGYHFLEIKYSKDEDEKRYLDRACIDNIKLTYYPLKSIGHRISPPISLDKINFYVNSKIEWEYDVSEVEFKDNVRVLMYASFDNGTTWIPLSNGQEISGFVKRNNYENKNLLLKETLVPYLNITPVLKKVNLSIDAFTKTI